MAVIDTLVFTEKEQAVWNLRNATPRPTHREIAQTLNLPTWSARQLFASALKKQIAREEQQRSLGVPMTVKEALAQKRSLLTNATYLATLRVFYHWDERITDDRYEVFLELLRTGDLIAMRHIGASRLEELRKAFL